MEDNLKLKIQEAKSLFIWPEEKPQIKPETNGWFTGASANVLNMFIQHLEPRFICELGSWTGMGSTQFLLKNAPKSHLLCLDHWSPDVNDHGNGGTTKYEDDDPDTVPYGDRPNMKSKNSRQVKRDRPPLDAKFIK
jgi:hypothetical protein